MSYGAQQYQQQYPAPPPAYEEEARQPLFGGDDGDDLYKESVANSPLEVRMGTIVVFADIGRIDRWHKYTLAFVRKVYSILTAQVLGTVVMSAIYMYIASVKQYVQTK